MFIKNWFFGAGINSFIGMYGRELRYYFANHQDNILTNYIDSTCYVFCDPLKIMTEQGVIGLLISVIACWIIIKKLRSYSMSLTYGLSSLLIFSLFSYPFELIPYQVILIFLLQYVIWFRTRKIKRLIIRIESEFIYFAFFL